MALTITREHAGKAGCQKNSEGASWKTRSVIGMPETRPEPGVTHSVEVDVFVVWHLYTSSGGGGALGCQPCLPERHLSLHDIWRRFFLKFGEHMVMKTSWRNVVHLLSPPRSSAVFCFEG